MTGSVSEPSHPTQKEMMNCSIFEERISEYLDGALPKQQANLLAAHALQCRDCRALMDEVKVAVHDLKGCDGAVEMPSRLENALLRIQAEHALLACADFEELITEFLDGFVPAGVYHRFEEHAAGCACCSSLLTEVVYAVAACHSVHTYEEFDVSEALTARLLAVQPQPKESLRRKIADRVAAFAGSLMPRATQSRGWSYATASGLAFAVFAFLIFGFSEDGSVSGIYREARAKAFSLYSHGSGLYSQKDEVIAGLERVRSNIGEVWNAIGGDTDPTNTEKAPALKLQAPKPEGRGGAGFSVLGN